MVTVDGLNLFSQGSQIHLSLGWHLTTSRHDPVSTSWVLALHTVCTNCMEPSHHPTWHCLLYHHVTAAPVPSAQNGFLWLCSVLQRNLMEFQGSLHVALPLCKTKKMPAVWSLARLTIGSCVWGLGGGAVAYLNLGERSWTWQGTFLLLFKKSFGHTPQHMDS